MPTVQLAIRIPAELVESIDRFQQHIQRQNPGMRVTRADAIRRLIMRGLEVEEAVVKKERRP